MTVPGDARGHAAGARPDAAATTDPVAELRSALEQLEDAPVEQHPDVLDRVHMGLVAALDALAGVGAVGQPPG